MPRTNGEDVKEILKSDMTADEIEPFVNTANKMVSNILADAGYAEDYLTEIEKWLAAHLASIKDQRVSSESIGDLSLTYQGRTDMGLNSTEYGQTALAMDYSGRLAAAMNAKKPFNFKAMP